MGQGSTAIPTGQISVQGPDGKIYAFPQGTPADEMHRAMGQLFPPTKQQPINPTQAITNKYLPPGFKGPGEMPLLPADEAIRALLPKEEMKGNVMDVGPLSGVSKETAAGAALGAGKVISDVSRPSTLGLGAILGLLGSAGFPGFVTTAGVSADMLRGAYNRYKESQTPQPGALPRNQTADKVSAGLDALLAVVPWLHERFGSRKPLAKEPAIPPDMTPPPPSPAGESASGEVLAPPAVLGTPPPPRPVTAPKMGLRKTLEQTISDLPPEDFAAVRDGIDAIYNGRSEDPMRMMDLLAKSKTPGKFLTDNETAELVSGLIREGRSEANERRWAEQQAPPASPVPQLPPYNPPSEPWYVAKQRAEAARTEAYQKAKEARKPPEWTEPLPKPQQEPVGPLELKGKAEEAVPFDIPAKETPIDPLEDAANQRLNEILHVFTSGIGELSKKGKVSGIGNEATTVGAFGKQPLLDTFPELVGLIKEKPLRNEKNWKGPRPFTVKEIRNAIRNDADNPDYLAIKAAAKDEVKRTYADELANFDPSKLETYDYEKAGERQPGEEGWIDISNEKMGRGGYINPGGEITMLALGGDHFQQDRAMRGRGIEFRHYPHDDRIAATIYGKPDGESLARLKELADDVGAEVEWSLLDPKDQFRTKAQGSNWRSLIHSLSEIKGEKVAAR